MLRSKLIGSSVGLLQEMRQGLGRLVRNHVRRAAIAGGLEAAHLVARSGLLPEARGRGAIFTLHHVRPRRERAFDPNGILGRGNILSESLL